MSTDDEAKRDPSALPEGESGLFSQLPRTRPGVRSPRRRDEKQPAKGKKQRPKQPAALRAEQAAAKARATAGPDPLEAPSTPPTAPPAREQTPPRHRETSSEPESDQGRSLGPGSIEDLAWAGVAVTAEAATLGVRLLGRAVDAARRATDRS